jgi:hypothetical protein
MNISEMQNQIVLSLSFCFSNIGFETDKKPVFYKRLKNAVTVGQINFLDTKSASCFNSNTASFTINLGIYFICENHDNPLPKEHECDVRGILLRNFYQKNPMNLKGFSFFHPERRRQDIWWVEKDGSNLNGILSNASWIVCGMAEDWINKYTDIKYILHYLKKKNEKSPVKGGPFGFGAIGSPQRQSLIEKIANLPPGA